MRLKSFEAENMKEALSLVKASLGDDAIIVSTREDKGSVRITAAVEEFNPEPETHFGDDIWDIPDEPLEGEDDGFALDTLEDMSFEGFSDDDFYSDTPVSRPERSITDDQDDVLGSDEETYFESIFAIDDDTPEDGDDVDFFDWEMLEDDSGDLVEQGFIEPITECLIRHNIPAKLADRLISDASGSGFSDTKNAFVAALDKIFHFKPMPVKRHTKPVILVGPPGAGKTLATAKLATRAIMNDLTPAVISTDTVRAGGVDQLKAFTRVLGVDLLTATDPGALEEAISMQRAADQIIIDTPGFSPFIEDDIKELASFLTVTDFDIVLVMPAGGDSQESADVARAFHLLGARSILPTRFDISRRFGGIISAAYYGQLTIRNASNTCAVAEGLIDMTPDILSEFLIPSLYNKSSSAKGKIKP